LANESGFMAVENTRYTEPAATGLGRLLGLDLIANFFVAGQIHSTAVTKFTGVGCSMRFHLFVTNNGQPALGFRGVLEGRRLCNCTLGEVLVARIIGISRNAALRDGVVVTKSRIPRGEPRMATRKSSSKRPQR